MTGVGHAVQERQMPEESYRGGRVRELPRPNRTYGRGRICATPGCNTALSMYNRFDHCWQHEPVHEYISRGKRKSRKEAA
jgi:hypothetical protein